VLTQRALQAIKLNGVRSELPINGLARALLSQ